MNDNDVKGNGNQQDYGMRIYDPRVGRFLSVDPISIEYPELTPFQFASNSPLSGVDLDGLEYYYAADGRFLGRGAGGGTQFRIATEYEVVKSVEQGSGLTNIKYRITKWKEFNVNSELTRLGRNEGGVFTGITSLTEDDVARVLSFGSAVIDNKYGGKAFNAAKEESGGSYGLLDFKYTLYDLLSIDRGHLIEIDRVLYNPNEAGNYLWGMLLTMHEYAVLPSTGAQVKTVISNRRLDEDHDQKAIKEGQVVGHELRKERRADIQRNSCPNCPRGDNKAKSLYSKVRNLLESGRSQKDYDRINAKKEKK